MNRKSVQLKGSFIGVLLIGIFALPVRTVSAGELDITQGGIGSSIDMRLLDDANLFDVDITQSGLANMLSLMLNSDIKATIIQGGNDGLIKLEVSSSEDSLFVQQHGENNVIDGVLSGQVNSSSITQTSSDNSFTFDIGGRNNILDVQQSGLGNNLKLNQKGSDTNFKLLQTGNDNELDIEQMGTGLGLHITQDGDGGKVTIRQ